MSMPPYGAPVAPPPAPAKKSNLPLIAALIGVLGLAIAVVIVLMNKDDNGGQAAPTSGASTSSTPATLGPKQTVEAFMEAAADGDGIEARKYTSDELDKKINDSGSGMADGQSYEVGDAAIDGDQATVPVTIITNGSEETGDLILQKKDDGTWEIINAGVFA